MKACDYGISNPCGNCLLCKRREIEAKFNKIKNEKKHSNTENMISVMNFLMSLNKEEAEEITFVRDDVPMKVKRIDRHALSKQNKKEQDSEPKVFKKGKGA
jgi:hypothetical protein